MVPVISNLIYTQKKVGLRIYSSAVPAGIVYHKRYRGHQNYIHVFSKLDNRVKHICYRAVCFNFSHIHDSISVHVLEFRVLSDGFLRFAMFYHLVKLHSEILRTGPGIRTVLRENTKFRICYENCMKTK